MAEDINITGLREKPQKDKVSGQLEPEQPYHMTSILRKLYPGIEWRQGSKANTLVDLDGNKVEKEMGGTLQPDFLSTELALIVEIDGNSDVKYGGHFTSTEQAIKDIERTKKFLELGYRMVSIPPYIQLDEVMIDYYFDIKYPEKLYPAASEHGFAHPLIPLPASFCKLGVDRFNKDMETIPQSVKDKIIQTLKERISGFEEEGFSKEDAMAKVLLPSMWHYV